MLLLVVSTTSVALASEPSRPGDLLFPVDRAIEDIRVTLARSDNSRNELLRKIGDERLSELRSIIAEETEDRTHDDLRAFLIEEELRSLQIEADIFSDITVIKVELNDRTSYFTTVGTNEEEIVSAVLSHYAFLSDEVVRDALRLQVEDRASRPQDRGEVGLRESGRDRVNEALKIVLPQLTHGSLEGGERIRRLEEELRGLDVHIDDEFRIRNGKIRYERKGDTRDERDDQDENDSRIEIRTRDERMRIEEKDGEVRVRITEDRDEKGMDGDDERDDNRGENIDSERDEDVRDEVEREEREDGENEDEGNEDDDSSGKGSGGDEEDKEDHNEDTDEEEDKDEDEEEGEEKDQKEEDDSHDEGRQ
jgi:hypothetical protein